MEDPGGSRLGRGLPRDICNSSQRKYAFFAANSPNNSSDSVFGLAAIPQQYVYLALRECKGAGGSMRPALCAVVDVSRYVNPNWAFLLSRVWRGYHFTSGE